MLRFDSENFFSRSSALGGCLRPAKANKLSKNRALILAVHIENPFLVVIRMVLSYQNDLFNHNSQDRINLYWVKSVAD